MGNNRKMEALKRCPSCGRLFARKRFWSGRLEDLSAFNRRIYCSRGCANRARLRPQGHRELKMRNRIQLDRPREEIIHQLVNKEAEREWERQEKGWYTRPGYGGIVQETSGWYWYPLGKSWRKGPYQTLQAAMDAAEQGLARRKKKG